MTPIRPTFNDYQSLVTLIRERSPVCGSTRVVAIDGRSGSGKTSFALPLAKTLGAALLHLEDVYRGWDSLAETPGRVEHDVLRKLAVDNVASMARWDWENGVADERMYFRPTSTLIIEGVGAGSATCAPYLSAMFWLEAPNDVRKERALSRDGEIFSRHWEMWATQEAELFTKDNVRSRADVIISTG